MRLKDRVALITGGGRGIGRAAAILFSQEGARVALVGRGREPLEVVRREVEAGGGAAVVIQGDVSLPEDTRRMAEETMTAFGRIDILIASAGIFTYGHVLDHDDHAWLNLLRVNLYGIYLSDKAVLPAMIQNRWGRIINVSATSAFTAAPGWSAQCSAKAGILGLTRALALEVATQGITVNAITPAWVRTEGADEAAAVEARAMGMTLDEYWQWTIKTYYPMGRITEPEEQARLMLYLASDEAAGLTGQAIALTAGSPW